MLYPYTGHLSNDARGEVISGLNGRLADVVALRIALKTAHWNVKGPQASALHPMFDKLAEAMLDREDTMAETIVALGGLAQATPHLVTATSPLASYPVDLVDGGGHCRALLGHYGTFIERLRVTRALCAKLTDTDTVQYLDGLLYELRHDTMFIGAPVALDAPSVAAASIARVTVSRRRAEEMRRATVKLAVALAKLDALVPLGVDTDSDPTLLFEGQERDDHGRFGSGAGPHGEVGEHAGLVKGWGSAKSAGRDAAMSAHAASKSANAATVAATGRGGVAEHEAASAAHNAAAVEHDAAADRMRVADKRMDDYRSAHHAAADAHRDLASAHNDAHDKIASDKVDAARALVAQTAKTADRAAMASFDGKHDEASEIHTVAAQQADATAAAFREAAGASRGESQRDQNNALAQIHDVSADNHREMAESEAEAAKNKSESPEANRASDMANRQSERANAATAAIEGRAHDGTDSLYRAHANAASEHSDARYSHMDAAHLHGEGSPKAAEHDAAAAKHEAMAQTHSSAAKQAVADGQARRAQEHAQRVAELRAKQQAQVDRAAKRDALPADHPLVTRVTGSIGSKAAVTTKADKELALKLVNGLHPEAKAILAAHPLVQVSTGGLRGNTQGLCYGRGGMKDRSSIIVDRNKMESGKYTNAAGIAGWHPDPKTPLAERPHGVSDMAANGHEATQSVFDHEVGHAIYNADPRAQGITKDAYDRTRTNGIGPVSRYALKNPNEYHSESFALYSRNPEALKTADPNGYKMVKDVLALHQKPDRKG